MIKVLKMCGFKIPYLVKWPKRQFSDIRVNILVLSRHVKHNCRNVAIERICLICCEVKRSKNFFRDFLDFSAFFIIKVTSKLFSKKSVNSTSFLWTKKLPCQNLVWTPNTRSKKWSTWGPPSFSRSSVIFQGFPDCVGTLLSMLSDFVHTQQTWFGQIVYTYFHANSQNINEI